VIEVGSAAKDDDRTPAPDVTKVQRGAVDRDAAFARGLLLLPNSEAARAGLGRDPAAWVTASSTKRPLPARPQPTQPGPVDLKPIELDTRALA
jgi:hypothetical protein